MLIPVTKRTKTSKAPWKTSCSPPLGAPILTIRRKISQSGRILSESLNPDCPRIRSPTRKIPPPPRAIAEPMAAPATPRIGAPRLPLTRSTDNTTLVALTPSITNSGVRVSPIPRSAAVPMKSSAAGINPIATMLRKVTPSGTTLSAAPSACMANGARKRPNRVASKPISRPMIND